jgi:phage gp29-like protein
MVMVMAKTAKQTNGPKKQAGMNTALGVGYNGLLMGLFNNLDQPVQNFDQLQEVYGDMITRDETIMTGLGFLAGNVVNKIGAYVHEDGRIQELVSASLQKINGVIEKFRRDIISAAFAHGYSVAEFTFAEDAGRWLLSSLIPLPPATCKFVMGKMPDNSVRVASVQQNISGQENKIPAYKCVIATNGRASEVYGDSILKPCYPWYKFKSYIPKFWAVGLDRYGTPIIHGKSNQIEALGKALQNLHTQGWIATTTDTQIELLAAPANSGGMSDSFPKAINMCNKLIYRSMFLPSLLESGEDGGSYALGDVHWKMFNDMTLQFAKDYAETELEQLWRPLIEYNYGPQENYGELPVSDSLSSEDKNVLADVFQKMIGSGVLDEYADNEWIRDMLRVPKLDEGKLPEMDLREAKEWESRKPGSGTKPQE